MPALTLDHARTIVDAALKAGAEKSFKPLAVVVLDARGALKAFAAQDGTSLKRGEIAVGKADGALAMGIGSRAIAKDGGGAAELRRGRDPCRRRLARSGAGRRADQERRRGDRCGRHIGRPQRQRRDLCLAGIEAAGLVADPGV